MSGARSDLFVKNLSDRADHRAGSESVIFRPGWQLEGASTVASALTCSTRPCPLSARSPRLRVAATPSHGRKTRRAGLRANSPTIGVIDRPAVAHMPQGFVVSRRDGEGRGGAAFTSTRARLRTVDLAIVIFVPIFSEHQARGVNC